MGQHCARVIVAALVSATLVACGRDAREPRVFDFGASVHLATVRPETRWIDIGEPFAREFLLGGWSFNEQTGGVPSSRVWSVGPHSAVRFYRFRPGALVMRFQLADQPFVREPGTIDVVVNGELVQSLATRGADEPIHYRQYSVMIPERVLRQGANVVEFRHPVHFQPPPGHPEPRPLALNWDYIELGVYVADTTPVAADGNLSIVGLTRLDYVIKIPANARLQWQGIQAWGDLPVPDTARFVATVQFDDGAVGTRVDLAASDFGRPQDIVLENRAGGFGVVTLLAIVDETAGGSPKGLTIVAPRLVGSDSGTK